MKRAERGANFFPRLFLSYLAILILPIVLAFVMLFITRSRMQQQKMEEYRIQLGYSADLVYAQVDGIKSLSDSICYDEDVNRFMNKYDDSYMSMSSSLHEWKTALTKFGMLNANVQYLGIYSSASGVLLGSNSAVPLNDVFFRVSLGFMGLERNQFLKLFETQDYYGYQLFDNGELCYLRTLNNRISRNLIIIHVNLSLIKSLMKQSSYGNCGFMRLYDDEGRLITESSSPSGKTEENEYFVEERHLENGWTLVSYIKKSEVNESSVQLLNQLLMIMALAVISGLVVALILTRNNSRPLKRIAASLSDQVPKEYLKNGDGFMFIEDSIANLIEKNRDYTTLNREQKDLLNHELLRRLLLGDYVDLAQLAPMFEHSDINLEGHSFAVITIITGENSGYASIVQILEKEKCWIFRIQGDLVCLFFLEEGMSPAEWKLRSHRLAEAVQDSSNGEAHLCISSIHQNAEQIHIARDESLTLARSISPDSPGELYYESITPSLSDMFYFYPPDIEILLLKLVKDGNVTQTENLLGEIRSENFSKRKLTVFMTKHLTFDLRGTIIRGLYGFTSEPRINLALHECCNIDDFDELCSYIVDICRQFKQSKNLQSDRMNRELENTIYQSMLEHYQDPNFSIKALSESLDMSERTLYAFIKDNLNSSFAKMLEALRITNACAMIRKNDLSIQEIATSVGYTNDHTFRQAFKRVMHVTPSEFINALQKVDE